MKVFLTGPGNDEYPSFYYQCKKAFEALGHEVGFFNYRASKFGRLPVARNVVSNSLKKEVLKFNPDLLLVIKGEIIPKGIIKEISSKGIKTADWTLDSPFGDYYSYNKIKNISEYDSVFVFDPYYLKKLREMNTNSFYLPAAADPWDAHKPAIPFDRRKYLYDVTFLGSYEPEREELIEGLRRFNVHVFGHNWKNKKGRIKNLRKTYVSGEDAARLFNSSKINLNLQALHGRKSLNLRTFELPATKSFQLVDYKSELPNLFKLDKEIVCYSNLDDLREKIRFYLEQPKMRDRIAEAGYKRVLEDHKVIDRIKTILKTMSL